MPRLLAATVFGTFSVLFVVRRSPWTYYAYVAFPVYFWGEILQEGLSWIVSSTPRIQQNGVEKHDSHNMVKNSTWKLVVPGLLAVATLQAMVVSHPSFSPCGLEANALQGGLYSSIHLESGIRAAWASLACHLMGHRISQKKPRIMGNLDDILFHYGRVPPSTCGEEGELDYYVSVTQSQ